MKYPICFHVWKYFNYKRWHTFSVYQRRITVNYLFNNRNFTMHKSYINDEKYILCRCTENIGLRRWIIEKINMTPRKNSIINNTIACNDHFHWTTVERSENQQKTAMRFALCNIRRRWPLCKRGHCGSARLAMVSPLFHLLESLLCGRFPLWFAFLSARFNGAKCAFFKLCNRGLIRKKEPLERCEFSRFSVFSKKKYLCVSVNSMGSWLLLEISFVFVSNVWESYAPLTEWYMDWFFLSMCNTNVPKWAKWKRI